MTPTPDQATALGEITSAQRRGAFHLLTGSGGTGKTTLMQDVVREFRRRYLQVAVTAPTHKAVAVLRRKMAEAGLEDVPCQTVHSLLSLKPYADGPRTRLKRDKGARLPSADAVVVDECSMVDAELHSHIRRWLPGAFVLFVGDPAQLPPVGEKESETFATRSRSHLETIVRQAAGNPILDAAHAIRASQGGAMDWSWCKPSAVPPLGVFVPGSSADRWLHRAFTSAEFHADNDAFRYLCWTNRRVAEVNDRVRRWLYGDTPTPFVAGERVLIRRPVFVGEEQVFATNEEAPVEEIGADEFVFAVQRRGDVAGWTARVPSWRTVLVSPTGRHVPVHMPRDQQDVDAAEARLIAEAKEAPGRWQDRFDFVQALARLQAVYALTTHNAQGSTYRTAFVDVSDIGRRAKSNVLEAQQLFYVAATRPTTSLVLVGTGRAA